MQLRLNTLASLLLFTFLLTNVSAQVFPVQTVVNHTLPHYNYLSQLADQNNHLQIITTLTDFNAQPIQARLRFRIEGPGYEINTIQSEVVGTPFLLEPGVPMVHSGIDLQQYFFEANLEWSPSGLNLNDLPFGGVTVCVDVIKDGVNQEVLSTNNCTFFEIIEAQPPFLTQPTCGANMDTLNMFPQFFWTPPPGFTPSPGASLNYRLIIYEQLDNVNYSQFLSSPLLGPGPGFVYESVVMGEMTQVPAFEIPFQNGKDYIWWVRAELTDDLSQIPIQMFVNNGLSEPCTFTYGESVSLEETLADGLYIDLFAEPQSQLKGRAYWEVNDNSQGQGLSSFEKYILEYRKKNTSQWHNDTVTGLEKVIFQLSPETTYEVRISGQIGTFISDPTDVVEFTTLTPIDYACGDQQMPYVPTQLIENENVLAGDQVQIGQFLMTLTEVQSTGSPGRYEGKGTIPIQFLADARAKVRFDDILIDEDFVVRDGRVDVITDGLDNWLNEQYMQFIDPIYVNGTIDSAYVDTVAGVAWVTIDGVDTSFTFDPPDYPIILNDESGYQWTIWPDGTVTVQGYLDPSEQWAVEADEVAVFVQNDSETFGFDAKEHMEWHEQYDVTQLSDTSYYFVPNKSIGKNVPDLVNVQLPQVGGTPVFKLDDQTDLSSTPIAGQPGDTVITHEITIPGISQTGEHTIYAYNGVNRVGKLNVYVYGEKERDVVIVPLTNSSLDSNALANALQQTLGEANLHVNFSIAPQWNDTLYTVFKNIQVPEEVGLMSKYSDDMRGLRDAYFNDSTITKQSGAYYLFLVPGFDDPTVDGYMVRGRGLGFVEAGSDYLTIAHELGHGMGALEHTWKNNGPAKGSTNNLMDYSVGKPGYPNLTKAQWKELRDIDIAPSIWDEVDDFLFGFDKAIPFYNGQQVWEFITPEQSKMGFVFLNGHRYKFRPEDDVVMVSFDKFGRVYAFKTATTTYKAFVTRGSVTKDYHCYFYVSEADYVKYRNEIYVADEALHSEEWKFLNDHKYQFVDCQFEELCFRISVIYRHSGIASAPNIWISEDCYVQDIFPNPEFTPVSDYSAGIYLGPSFFTNNFTVLDGDEEECWFPLEVIGLDQQGAGAIIFYELNKDIPQESLNLQDLVQLANHFSDISDDTVRVFYDYETNAYAYFGVKHAAVGSDLYYNTPTLIPEVFRREGIYSLAAFEQAFPKDQWFYDFKHDSIISTTNIRSSIPRGYNVNTIDYQSAPIPSGWDPFNEGDVLAAESYFLDLLNNYHYIVNQWPEMANEPRFIFAKNFIEDFLEKPAWNLAYHPVCSKKLSMREYIIHILSTFGWFDLYEYSMIDLVQREIHRRSGGTFYYVIQDHEKKGSAYPLTTATNSAQYIAQFGTTSAFFQGIPYLDASLGLADAAMGFHGLQYSTRIRNIKNSFRARYRDLVNDSYMSSLEGSIPYPTYIKNGAKLDEVSLNNAYNHINDVTLTNAGFPKYNRTTGLSGCHNHDNFMKQTVENGGRIEIQNINSGGAPGVKQIEYKVVGVDAQMNLIDGQYLSSGAVYTKTTYSPSVYSETKIKQIGYNAYKDAMNSNSFYPHVSRSFDGDYIGLKVAGHYKEVQGKKVISSWWIE